MNSKKILIINNNKNFSKEIYDNLVDFFDLTSVQSFDQSINLINTNKFDLIFLDSSISSSYGLDLFDIIKKSHFNSNSLVIMTLNEENSSIFKNALNYGIKEFIVRPIKQIQFISRINSLIEKEEIIKELYIQNNELNELKKIFNESDIISKTDISGKITYVNNKFCETSGYSKEELIGKTHNMLRHEDNSKLIYKKLWNNISNKKTFKTIIKNKKKNGDAYYVDATISPILDIDGNIKEYIAVRHDITSLIHSKTQLLDIINNNKNSTVVLTQIVNYDMIRQFYSESVIHRFDFVFQNTLKKAINNLFNISNIFILDNGLFGFVIPSSEDPTTVNIFIQDILKKIKSSGVNFQDTNYDVDLVFSFSQKTKHVYEDTLIGIYQALETQEKIVYSYDFYSKKQSEAKEKLKILSSIKNALKNKSKIVSHFQPIVDNKNKQIIKYESLIRMINEDGELLSPFFFLDLAKQTGYYNELTLKTIHNAAEVLDCHDIEININLSMSDLKNINIRTELLSLVTKTSNNGRITFELLEDEHIVDFNIIKDFIALVKILGNVKIAIDDFGSGYSNYERILDFQPDYIKIDGSLIKKINEPYTRSIIKSIVLFAKENNIKTVAEFVSSEEVYNSVKDLDIDYSQGFYFGKAEQFNCDTSNL